MSAEPQAPLATKLCPHCVETKPLGAFGTSKQTKDGLTSWCKDCRLEDQRRLRARKKAERPPKPTLPEGMKKCGRCHEVKPYSDFWNQISRKDGLDPYCITCEKERRAENAEWWHAYMAQYAADHPDEVTRNKQKSRELHRDEENAKARQRRAEEPEKNQAYFRDYYRDHPEYWERGKRARRARELGNGFEPYDKRLDVFQLDGYRCQAACGEILNRDAKSANDPKAPEVGHIIQMGDGGPDYLWNVRTECRDCNRSKLTAKGKDNGRLSQLRLPLRVTEAEQPPPSEIYYRIGRLVAVVDP